MNMDLELKMMLERIENDKKHNERKRRLEKQKEREKIRKLKDRLAKIDDEAKSSVLFNAINLTKIIAELISDKEKQPYEPLILDVHFSNGFSRKIFIISKSENKEDICGVVKDLGFRAPDMKVMNTDDVYKENGLDIYSYKNLDFSEKELEEVKEILEYDPKIEAKTSNKIIRE